MHRLFVAAIIAALSLLGPSGIVAAPSTRSSSDAVFNKSSAVITLKAMPLSTYDGHIKGYMKTSPSQGKLRAKSAAYTKYLGYLKQQHSDFQKWLQRNVPSAKITSQYFVTLNGVAVKLNGAAIGKIANSPYVSSIEYVTLYHPTMSESYKLINASGAWGDAGGRTNAGRGIKVGIIDTGIDQDHPFFDPTGFSYPEGFPKGDTDYTTEKVIVARVFNNKLNQSGFDAEAIQDHGTHVAGTVAGVTGKTAEVLGVSIDDMSGVAPGAWLGNYNVFPGNVTSARSEDILNAVEAAVKDGMDVLNLSLGGAYGGNNDLLAMGVDNAVAAGVVVAISAGNEGPGGNTIGSPGRARNVITVGASTNQHFVGQPLTYPSTGGTTVGVAVGDFDPLVEDDYDLFFVPQASPATDASTGCSGIDAAAAGKLVVVDRGICTFSTKVRSAIAAGALGVVVHNNVAGDPTAMAMDGLGDDDLPAVMIGKAEGAALRASGETTAHATATFSEFITGNGDILAGFSSQGPTSVDFNIKPDLTSVGVNVLSSIPLNSGDDWAFFSGTSMSSPHIAGSAAVELDLHPAWTPAQVKSALVNTADRVVTDAFDAAHDVGPRAQGAGRENLSEAADANILFWPVAVSFGKLDGSQTQPTSMTVTLWNLTGDEQTLSVTEKKFTPSSFSLTHSSVWNAGTITTGDNRIETPSEISIPAGDSAELTVTVNPGFNHQTIQGWLDLSGDAGDYTLAYMAFVP